MNNVSGVMQFSIGIIALIVIVTIIYFILEKRKKKNVTRRFRKFSEDHIITRKNLRAVPRVTVPSDLEVILILTDNEYLGLKARALDLSLSGFSVKPDFPLRKLFRFSASTVRKISLLSLASTLNFDDRIGERDFISDL